MTMPDAETIGDLLPDSLPAAEADDQLTEFEQDDLRIKTSVAYYAVPVALIHLAIIYTIVSAKNGWHLPSWLHGNKIFALLWTSGAMVGALLWGWKRGGIPMHGKLWLRGWQARLLVVGLILLIALRLFA